MAAADYVGTYGGRSQFRIRLHIETAAVSGNSSAYNWWLYGEKTAASTAYSANATGWSVNIGGQVWTGNATQDFRSTNSILFGSGTAGYFGHDGNGYLNFSASASHNGDTPIGYASCAGTFSADRIAQVPGAPYSVSLNEATSVSMRYVFSGTTDGGSGITGWQIQYATDAAFTQNVSVISSNGNSVLTGLTPGTTYYVRSRGSNAVGWSAYSDVFSLMTLSGGKIRRASAWIQANPKILSANTWKNPVVMIYDAGSWKPAK